MIKNWNATNARHSNQDYEDIKQAFDLKQQSFVLGERNRM